MSKKDVNPTADWVQIINIQTQKMAIPSGLIASFRFVSEQINEIKRSLEQQRFIRQMPIMAPLKRSIVTANHLKEKPPEYFPRTINSAAR